MKVLIKELDLKISRRINKNIAIKRKIIPYKIKENKIYVYYTSETKDFNDETLYGKEIVKNELELEKFNLLIENIYIGCEENTDEIIISKAIESEASDIHFEPNEFQVTVRIRVDGKLNILTVITKEDYQRIKSKIKVNSEMDITETRKPQDGKILFNYKEKKYDLRIATINTLYGEKLVIRILYGSTFNYNLDTLSLNKLQKEKLLKIIKVRNGILIINGPTGSGKSTTLYTILNKLNTEEVNIMTIEDPIEVTIDGINQIALNRTIGIDFANGLRSLLRADPDILMIGEIRDSETAQTAIKASITGHKVYSTIHTKNPGEVILRLESMGVENYMIKEALVGLISQRLIRVLCNKCKEKIGTIKINNKDIYNYKPIGCKCCNYSGYKGRTIVAAVHYIEESTRKNISNLDLQSLNNNEMLENLKELIIEGKISLKDFKEFIEEEDINFEEKIFEK